VAATQEREERYRQTPPSDLPSEHLLHLLWQRQDDLRRPLTTLDRQVVTVLRPGRWRRSSGPDFVEAKLRFDDGPIRVGAVELHVLASDWQRHGHDRDPAYAQVLLHVVWRHDGGPSTVVNSDGGRIPQLELAGCVERPLTELQEAIGEEPWLVGEEVGQTPCQRSLQELAPVTIGQLLDMAGEERWRQKASRFALKAARRGVEQALYEALLEGLGYQGNRQPFWRLARLAPIERLRLAAAGPPAPLQLQAILFGVAGFLPYWQAQRRALAADSLAYLEGLLALWEPLSGLFPERLDERQWRTAGIRPANFPPRRIAAAGHLLAGLSRQSLMDRLLTPLRALAPDAGPAALRDCQRQLAHQLHQRGEGDFWRHRYTIAGPRHARPSDLLGAGRATTLVVDVLLPAAAALAQLGHEPIALGAVRALYRTHPRLPANEITRDMLRQFFGADRSRAAVVDSACRQQGLIQLYRDFCLNEQETCQECAFPRLVARLERRRTDARPEAL
jgi:hypothetical protein